MSELRKQFWELPLNELTHAEWEALCDGCGRCCLHKFQDEETDEILYTDVACRLLDVATCRCSDYTNRKAKVPDCLIISLENEAVFPLLPSTCAYRLRYEGSPLEAWHPLISGSSESVVEAGISMRDEVISEKDVDMDAIEDRIRFSE
jgi:hypothetical protein